MEKDPFIRAAIIEHAIEAQVIESILKERCMAYRIQSFHDTAYNGLFQFQKGWGELLVPASINQEVIEIVAQVRSTSIFPCDDSSENDPGGDSNENSDVT